jgi:hypothetical protein
MRQRDDQKRIDKEIESNTWSELSKLNWGRKKEQEVEEVKEVGNKDMGRNKSTATRISLALVALG